MIETDVLVVGAGPVGLALAGDLGWREVSCLVIERGTGAIEEPRMDMVSVRTMEHCRRWGIVPWVEECPYPGDRLQDNVYVTSLTGFELGRARFPSMADTEPPPESPEHRYRCPQDMFDPILRRHALRYPSVRIENSTELEGVSQTADAAVATARRVDTGDVLEIRARFVVGCDGAGSRVRELLGVEMVGDSALTYTTNVVFRCADLDSLHDKGAAYRWVFLGEEGTWATLVAINGRDRWRFSLIGDDRPRVPSADEIQAAIRRAVGIDRHYDVLSVLPWVRRESVARRYRDGRIFLAGDACHLMSPTGGFGMNTGIGDAVDLSWKLDAVLSGWGGPTLLDAYETERRPVVVRNAAEASGNLHRMLEPRRNRPPAALWDPGEEGVAARRSYSAYLSELMDREWNAIGIHLGYSYAGSPLCVADRGASYVDSVTEYKQTTVPGCRAPHAWLPDGRSTLDWFGKGYVLVQSGGPPDLAREVVVAARARGVPLSLERSEAVATAYERRLVLVRPDGHVAWRSDEGPETKEAEELVARVRGAFEESLVAVSSEELAV